MLNAKIGCANHNGKVCDDFSFVFNWTNRPTGHLADVHREGLFKVCVDGSSWWDCGWFWMIPRLTGDFNLARRWNVWCDSRFNGPIRSD